MIKMELTPSLAIVVTVALEEVQTAGSLDTSSWRGPTQFNPTPMGNILIAHPCFCPCQSVSFLFCSFLAVSGRFCLIMSVSVCFCPFLSASVLLCPFLSVTVSFCQFTPVCFCPFVSASVRLCPYMTVSVCFCQFGDLFGIGATIRTHKRFSVSRMRDFPTRLGIMLYFFLPHSSSNKFPRTRFQYINSIAVVLE